MKQKGPPVDLAILESNKNDSFFTHIGNSRITRVIMPLYEEDPNSNSNKKRFDGRSEAADL